MEEDHEASGAKSGRREHHAEIIEPSDVEPQQGQLVGYSVTFSGPLPPPGVLAQYNDALPNGAERIVAMAEDQARHRRAMEKRGQWFGFVIAMTVLVGGIVLIALGKSAEGLVPLVSGLAGLVGLFIYGQWQGGRVTRQLERAASDRDPPTAALDQ